MECQARWGQRPRGLRSPDAHHVVVGIPVDELCSPFGDVTSELGTLTTLRHRADDRENREDTPVTGQSLTRAARSRRPLGGALPLGGAGIADGTWSCAAVLVAATTGLPPTTIRLDHVTTLGSRNDDVALLARGASPPGAHITKVHDKHSATWSMLRNLEQLDHTGKARPSG